MHFILFNLFVQKNTINEENKVSDSFKISIFIFIFIIIYKKNVKAIIRKEKSKKW